MKQIKIEQLLPLLKSGYVAMDSYGYWNWFYYSPEAKNGFWGNVLNRVEIHKCFNIAPFDGDWKDSLIKVEHKEEE